MNIKCNKHLTLAKRIAIAKLSVQYKSFNKIFEAIGNNAKTITN